MWATSSKCGDSDGSIQIMKILVCNAGSSSLKFSLYEADDELLLAEGGIDWSTEPTRLVLRLPGQQEVSENLKLRKHADAAARIFAVLQAGPSAPLHGPDELLGVGHRVVHGGERFTAAVRITPEVKRVIKDLAELAPLHNPVSLDGINAVEQAVPGVPQVAAFDTAFHATMSETARTYPVPQKWTRQWGVRRYGFHGLSHSYCACRATEMLGRRDVRLVIAHLGNGASASAVCNGVCVDTSMGFTPLDGLMMGTRSGSVDPGANLHFAAQRIGRGPIGQSTQPGIRIARRLGRFVRHASGFGRATAQSGCSARGRRVCPSHSTDGRRDGSDAWRHRCLGVHSWSRRTCAGDPQAGL